MADNQHNGPDRADTRSHRFVTFAVVLFIVIVNAVVVLFLIYDGPATPPFAPSRKVPDQGTRVAP
jgi:hypothetical protein